MNLRLFYPDQQQQQQMLKVNERIPRTVIPGLVEARKEHEFLVLTKLRCFEDWGPFKWEINHGKEQGDPILEPPVQDIVAVPEVIDAQPGPGALPVPKPVSPPPDLYECCICTFLNPKNLANCEMCGNKR